MSGKIDLKQCRLPSVEQYGDSVTALLTGQEMNLSHAFYAAVSGAASIVQLRQVIGRNARRVKDSSAQEFFDAVMVRAEEIDPEAMHKSSILAAISREAIPGSRLRTLASAELTKK